MSGNSGNVADASSSNESDFHADSVFDVLSNRRRRFALSTLSEYDDPMTLADLADEVAVREHDARVTDISAEAVTNIYIALYHNHIPKMEEAGIVEYSQKRDMVALTGNVDELTDHMDRASSE